MSITVKIILPFYRLLFRLPESSPIALVEIDAIPIDQFIDKVNEMDQNGQFSKEFEVLFYIVMPEKPFFADL